MPEEIFLRNVLSVDVDPVRGINRYTITSMHDARREDARGVWYEIVQRTIEEISYTWDEIEQAGGTGEINKQLKECYNAVVW